MTLKVELLERDLHLLFVAALEELCPGSGFVVSEEGVVSRARSPECDGYCDHTAACNLIDTLIAAEGTTTLKFSGFGNGYSEGLDVDPPGGTVFWRPEAALSGRDQCGGRRTRPSIVLAHELVHALQDQLNTISKGDPDIEYQAVRGENQIRRALCEPLRLYYGADEVPSYDAPFLNARDARNCSCSSRDVLEELRRELRCLARKLLRCLLDRLDSVPSKPFVPYPGAEDPGPGPEEVDRVVARRIGTAMATRSMSPHAAYVHELTREARASAPFCACLESVGLDGAYGAFLVYPVEDRLRVVTNFLFGRGASFFVRGPDDLLEYTFPPEHNVGQRLAGIRFVPGLGGTPTVHGGSVQFLSLKGSRAAPVMNTALYGYRYAAFDGPSQPPTGDDGPRWEAVSEVYSIAAGVMANPASAVRLVQRKA